MSPVGRALDTRRGLVSLFLCIPPTRLWSRFEGPIETNFAQNLGKPRVVLAIRFTSAVVFFGVVKRLVAKWQNVRLAHRRQFWASARQA